MLIAQIFLGVWVSMGSVLLESILRQLCPDSGFKMCSEVLASVGEPRYAAECLNSENLWQEVTATFKDEEDRRLGEGRLS